MATGKTRAVYLVQTWMRVTGRQRLTFRELLDLLADQLPGDPGGRRVLAGVQEVVPFLLVPADPEGVELRQLDQAALAELLAVRARHQAPGAVLASPNQARELGETHKAARPGPKQPRTGDPGPAPAGGKP